MPVLETKGALSAQGYGLTTSQPQRVYIEDVFSTWLYTGNSSTQTITNGIDLAGKGGLVWLKGRSGATDHALFDTARGAPNELCSNNTANQVSGGLSSFLANGFALNSQPTTNGSGATYTSWTFRKQPKFFDIVTYTGNGVAGRTINHNLGSVPGCIIVKTVLNTNDWAVYHRSLGATYITFLNSTAGSAENSVYWNNTSPTSTVFSVGTDATVNSNGQTYVAYLFAHDAGGFGATGADNVISCGSVTTDGSGNASVTLGYEPQFVLYRAAPSSGGLWNMFDSARGWVVQGGSARLLAHVSDAEINATRGFPTSNGFRIENSVISTGQIYIAIRRGPMRTPTTGTSVFSPIASTAATGTALTTGFPVDLQINARRAVTTEKNYAYDRLRGISTNATESGQRLRTQTTFAEDSYAATLFWGNTGFQMPSINNTTSSIYWNFRRAPGFFDVVCYTGDGNNYQIVQHNLGVLAEFAIVKRRSGSADWAVGARDLSGPGPNVNLLLNTSASTSASPVNGKVIPNWDINQFALNDGSQSTVNNTNLSGSTYVAYLFASCPGVSKVGSYTGTGATQVINCGFAAGARFVLIKRTDSTGDWYVWDSARGIVAGNDPYLLLNSTAAEVTTTDWVDTAASGFELSNAAGNLVNTNGASYIFLSVA